MLCLNKMRYITSNVAKETLEVLEPMETNDSRWAKCVHCGKIEEYKKEMSGYRFRAFKLVDVFDCGCNSWERQPEEENEIRYMSGQYKTVKAKEEESRYSIHCKRTKFIHGR